MASKGSSSHRSRSVSLKKKCKRMPAAAPPPPPCPKDDLFAAHFEKLTDPTVGDLKVICNYCARLFTFRADEAEFGTLTVHLNTKHSSKLPKEEAESESEHSSQGSTGTYAEVFTYSYKKARKMIAKFICVASLPFRIAESESFENLLKACNPLAKKIPQIEIIREIRDLVGESLLVLVKDFVKFPNRVSICCDVWYNEWGWHFVRMTCHWVDESWTIQKRLIGFKCIHDVPRTAADITNEMPKVLQSCGLDSKVFSISFDNKIAGTYTLEALSNACQPFTSAKFFHVRCMSNILTECAQEALNLLGEEISPVRNAAFRLWMADTTLLRKWVAFCKKKGLIPRRFLLDFSGHWDMTYRMLNGCYEYRDALCTFFSEQQVADVEVSSSNWDACSCLCQLLGVFYHAIVELSVVYRPTSVLVMDNCAKIALAFNSLIGRDGISECVAEMQAKWLKHFHEIPAVFLLAKVFEPRIRLHGLEKMLEIYYDALFPIKDEKTPIPSVIVANVKKCLYDLFEEYRVKHGARLGINMSSSSSHGDDIPLPVRLQNLYDEVSEKRPRSYGSNPYGEVDAYLTASFEYIVEPEFNLLQWWSRMAMPFPVMSLLAKDILVTPASTVSVEQAFGTGGYELDKRQSRLSEHMHFKILENQLLLGDWTKAETRSQENDYDDADESETISDSEL